MADELKNIAPSLEDDELKQLGGKCVEDWTVDDESRSEWLTMHATWIDQFYQREKAKNPPWEGASQESIPMVAEACTQFHARAFQAMFPNRNIIKAMPTGTTLEQGATAETIERAKRVGRHMSWQLMVQDTGYKRDKDRLLLSTPLHGSCFTKTYYHPLLQRNVVENVRAEDLVIPYGNGPRDVETVERKTHQVWMSVNDTKILAESGFFTEPAEPFTKDAPSETQEAVNKATGVNPPGPQNQNQALILEQHRVYDLDGDDIAEPYTVWVDAQSEKVLRVAVRYEGEAKRPIEYFTHWPFIENPDGAYGLGMGHLIGQINTAVNKLLRQTIDAGTLSTVGNTSGFITQSLAGAMGGEIQFQLGKFKKLPASTDDITKGIYQMKFAEPSATLFNVIQMLMQKGDRLATVTEALTGQTEKVIQPTALLALIEQGLQVFSTVYERLLTSWESELRKLYRLNGQYLNEKEYFSVIEADGSVVPEEIGRADYAEDLMVVPIADPKMATEQQRLKKAEAEWMFLSQNPLVLQSPPHFRNASKRYLDALGSKNIDEVLPPVTERGVRQDDPMVENMMALAPLPTVPQAFPDQDHITHIAAHEALANDPEYSKRLSAEGMSALQNHIQQHVSLMYGGTEIGQGAMGQAPADGGVPIQIPGAVPGQLAGGGLDGGAGQTESVPGGS